MGAVTFAIIGWLVYIICYIINPKNIIYSIHHIIIAIKSKQDLLGTCQIYDIDIDDMILLYLSHYLELSGSFYF